MVRIGYPEENEWLYDFDPKKLESQRDTLKQRYDIFSFWQRFPDTDPRYKYFMEWDNVAVLEIKSFQDWWRSISRKTRNMVRKAKKLGVLVREVVPDEEFWKGFLLLYLLHIDLPGRPKLILRITLTPMNECAQLDPFYLFGSYCQVRSGLTLRLRICLLPPSSLLLSFPHTGPSSSKPASPRSSNLTTRKYTSSVNFYKNVGSLFFGCKDSLSFQRQIYWSPCLHRFFHCKGKL